MTSIEGLEEKFKIYLPQIHQKGLEDAFQQAKLLHKQEIKKSYEDGKNLIQYKDEWGERYYNETFGSKRSDETPEAPATYKVDTWTSFHHDKERIIRAQISDEEIERGAKEWYNKEGYITPSKVEIRAWVKGAKWYREQTKKINL